MKKKERLLYIRELERFTNRIVNFCSQSHTKEEFDAYIDKIFAPLASITKVFLSSEYLKALEAFVERTANLPNSSKEMEQIKEDVLKEANLLRKLKRKRRFSKPKHKKAF